MIEYFAQLTIKTDEGVRVISSPRFTYDPKELSWAYLQGHINLVLHDIIHDVVKYATLEDLFKHHPPEKKGNES